jgi:hypothetical protein
MLGWRPPAEHSAWVRAEAERRDVDLKVILDEALAEYMERVQHDLTDREPAGGRWVGREQRH